MYLFDYIQTLAFRLRNDDSGAVIVEYALLTGFVSIIAAIGMMALGDSLGVFYLRIAATLYSAGDPIPPLNS